MPIPPAQTEGSSASYFALSLVSSGDDIWLKVCAFSHEK